jgi:hypothetical protein
MEANTKDITEETREIFKSELGDVANKKLPKGIKPKEFIQYLRERFKNCPDKIQFREGANHTLASVDNGKNWIPLAERHPSHAIDEYTAKRALRQLDFFRMLVIQTQQNEIPAIGEKVVYRLDGKKTQISGILKEIDTEKNTARIWLAESDGEELSLICPLEKGSLTRETQDDVLKSKDGKQLKNDLGR